MEKKNIGKIIISILLIAVAVVVFSPSLQGFLPENIKTGINAFIDEHFAENALAGITFAEIGAAILSLVITFAVANLVKFAIGSLKFKKHRSETLRQLLEKLLYYIVYICGAIVALSCLGVDTAAIFVSAGVLAIIVGFGAQSLIEDVITGLFIILEGEIAVGDIITIDGFRGEVKSVGLRTISIIDLGGNIRIINNSEIGSLVNLSDVTSVAVVNVPVSYEDSLVEAENAVKEALSELPSEYPEIFKEAPVYKGVDKLLETHIELMVVANVSEENIYNARRLMQREIRISCEKAKLSAPCEG